MTNLTTPVFLEWLSARIVNIYKESENVDFVRRLRVEIERARTLRANLSVNHNTYQLVEVGLHESGDHLYELRHRGRPGGIMQQLILTDRQAEDLSRQLDAPVDYFND